MDWLHGQGPQRRKIGKVSANFLDDRSGRPVWLAIKTGLFKSHSSFMPMDGASSDGDHLVVAYDKAMVTDAPRVNDDRDGHLEPHEDDAPVQLPLGQAPTRPWFDPRTSCGPAPTARKLAS